MNAFLDLIKLFLESFILGFEESGSSKWIALAAVVAAVTFVLNFYLCRLWNRFFDFTVWHRICFSVAALLAAIAVLAWPASFKMTDAVNNRVKSWVDYLKSPEETIPVIQEWADDMKSVGWRIPEKLSWFNALPWKTRAHLQKQGLPKGELVGNTFIFPDHRYVGHLDLCEGLRAFQLDNPYLFARLDFDFSWDFDADKKNSTVYKDYTKQGDANRDSNGKLMFSICSDLMGEIVQSRLVGERGNPVESQTEWLAKWTRKVGPPLILLSIGFPVLLSGLISYFQIRVGQGRRRGGPGNAGKSPSASYRSRMSGRR